MEQQQEGACVAPPADVVQTKNKAMAAACETPPSKKSKVSSKGRGGVAPGSTKAGGGGASLITGFFTRRSEKQPQDAETTPKPACHQKPAAPSPQKEDEVPAVRTLDMLAEDSSDGSNAQQQQEGGRPSTTATPGDHDRQIVAELIEDEPVCDPVDLGNGGSIVGDMAMKLKPHQVPASPSISPSLHLSISPSPSIHLPIYPSLFLLPFSPSLLLYLSLYLSPSLLLENKTLDDPHPSQCAALGFP